MSQILDRLRAAETRPLDAHGKLLLYEVLQDARAEIVSLRDELRRLSHVVCYEDNESIRRVLEGVK